jgi:hypothetical protein
MIEYRRRMINAGLASEDDFDRSGALKSKITFKALVLPWDIIKRTRHWESEEGQELGKFYWSLKDKYGANFSTREENLAVRWKEYIAEGVLVEVSGNIKIVRGSTYLNAEAVKRFDINEYEDVTPDQLQSPISQSEIGEQAL